MSDNPDKDSKTEDASEKKILDAKEKGDFPVSRELNTFVMMIMALAGLVFLLFPVMGEMAGILAVFLDHAGEMDVNNSQEIRRISLFLWDACLKTVGPLLALIAISGILSTMIQMPLGIFGEKIKPQWSRLSLSKGWGRIFGRKGLLEFLKAIMKLTVVGMSLGFLLWSKRDVLIASIHMDPVAGLRLSGTLIVSILALVATATILLALADVASGRQEWLLGLRMTKQEVKDEHKQSEGDPAVKARFRSLALSRSRRRMMANVPKAAVVVVNPTHYAVALKYQYGAPGAPVVTAKGIDSLALRIRALAEESGVPVIENRELARQMYKEIDLENMIPEKYYRAVAEIIHLLGPAGKTATT